MARNPNRLPNYGTAFSGDITPATNDGAALGTAALSWSDLFLASGGVINFNNGGATITASGATLIYNANIAMGGNQISNVGTLGMGSGSVIDFNSADVTITHSANLLTLVGGGLNLGTNDLGSVGNTTFTDAKNIVFQTTTGTKIGTATDQKLAFFNAAPIVQQTTTSQTPATFAANTSGTLNDSATWDGYTIGDVVAILRAFGLLA